MEHHLIRVEQENTGLAGITMHGLPRGRVCVWGGGAARPVNLRYALKER